MWTYSRHYKEDVRGHIYLGDDKKGACTIQLIGAASMSQVELDCHGKRMAAAPDLLEACEAAVTWAKTPGNHGGNPYQHVFMGLIQHAIKKAKGA